MQVARRATGLIAGILLLGGLTHQLAGQRKADPLAGLDAYLEKVRTDWGIPGIAVGIVKDDSLIYAKGFGVKEAGKPDPVDPRTLFAIGSNTKSFTATAAAMLVDEGKLEWNDKVTDRLPGFQMYDPWVTREMTVLDLLVHHSGLGLGEGDLLFVPRTNLSRAESVHRLRFLKPATSFRSGYAYDNVLYMVAGQMIESISGETWEHFTAEHLLKPAGMLHSTSDEAARFADPDRAYPHARVDGVMRGIGDQQVLNERDELGRNGAPAGGLTVSASDFARWIRIQLDGGKIPGSDKHLFSKASRDMMWTPVTIIPIHPAPAPIAATTPSFNLYALGWDVRDYRGTKILEHGGAVFGFQTAIVLIPSKKVGFSIEINSEDGEIILGLMYELLDHYLGAPFEDWPARFIAFKKTKIAAALKALHQQTAKPAKVGPSLPLARYAGIYHDPWYGNIEVAVNGGKLTIDFKSTPRMSGTLEHWQYDTFKTDFTDKTIEPAYVTFNLDANGNVERVTMKAVSPLADFSYDYHDLLFKPVGHSK